MDNYLMLNGKKIELTEEQIKTLGLTSSSPFDKVEIGKKYYCIESDGDILALREEEDKADVKLHNCANYCTDKSLLKQRALHENLSRQLWRFACENDEPFTEEEWKDLRTTKHTVVKYQNDYRVSCVTTHNEGGTYFRTRKIAQQAIDEIIKPFVTEHKEFVW